MAGSKETYVDEPLDGDAPTAAVTEHPLISGRYEDLGPIGEGGMGEIRRVRDLDLNRTLAMKIVHPRLVGHQRTIARFVEEAQATAQLQHPSIIPIHDIGTLPDGRVWFTMKEVHGITLEEAAAKVHRDSGPRWEPTADGWTFRRLIAHFLAVCQAVAFAHERGVIHRDLKPENVMIGAHGETEVLDWGLAKVLGVVSAAEQHPSLPADLQPITTDRSGSHPTRMGTVAGTPAYMSPEQARGEVDRVGPHSDVYALGAMLYQLLANRVPYEGEDAGEVVSAVRAGPPPPVTEGVLRALPAELVEVCQRAMAREPEDRFASAKDLADEVAAWLDGLRKREQALEITTRALDGEQEAADLVSRAAALQAEGEARLAEIARWEPEEAKALAWDKLREAAALRRTAELRQLDVDQGLHGALRVAPDLPEAHAALVRRILDRHARAEAARDGDGVARAETLIRLHAAALPADDPTRLHSERTLQGTGALTLVTDPPGAEVHLFRYEERNRRLVEVPVGPLGTTPLVEVPLPMGTYLCRIRHPDRDEVRYPVSIPRLGHWDGVPPGGSEPTPIWLPPRGFLGPDEVYVPAGWFASGGDEASPRSFPARRLWCDAMVFARFQATNRDVLAFLDGLVAEGRTEEALRHAPRERATAGEAGAMIYAFDGTHFTLQPDADGELWDPDWPVLMVDWFGASAYCAWKAARTGRPWRLPAELEWEKAARGVDGRFFPWGDHLDPSWTCMTESHSTARLPATVHDFPVDESPYGVRGMGGNAESWCLDVHDDPCPVVEGRVTATPPEIPSGQRAMVVARGGSWLGASGYSRAANRIRLAATDRHAGVSFRPAWRLSELDER